MNKNITETIVGALVLIIAAGFLYYAYNTTQTIKNDSNRYIVYAKFDRADGINQGGDVKLAGIKIGKVISQELDPKTYQAVLELSINSSILLPIDTSAEIIGNGLLGEKYVSLTPGSEDEFLKDKSNIQFTQSSISFESLIGKFMFSGEKDQSKNPKTSDVKS